MSESSLVRWTSVSSLETQWQHFAQQQPHAEKFLQLATLPASAPRILGVGLGYGCNFGCQICYYNQHQSSFGAAPASFRQVYDFLQGFKGLQCIILGMEGEPFCHPSLWDFLESSSQVSSGIMLSSNASLITAECALRLRNFPIACLALSIDAVGQTAYARLRRGGDFNVFCTNARRLASSMGESVILHAVVMRQNMNNLVLLPALARNLGISRISISQLRVTPQAKKHGLCRCDQSELKDFWLRFLRESDGAGTEIIIDDMFSHACVMQHIWDTSDGRYGSPYDLEWGCLRVWQYAALTSRQQLVPCCGDFWPKDILPTQICTEGIYNNRYIRILRVLTTAGAYPEVCQRSCFRSCQSPPSTDVLMQRLAEMHQRHTRPEVL